MLNFRSTTRPALPRSPHIKHICIRHVTTCRSNALEGSNTVERPSIEEDAKVKSTLSTLDALLGTQDTAGPSGTSSSSSSNGSSNASPSGSPWASFPPATQTSSSTLPTAAASPHQQQPLPSSSSRGNRAAGPSFEDVMGFSGLAPDVINGRAAMVGFLVAITRELQTGESVFSQLVSGGAVQAAVVIAAVTAASFAPVLLGTPLDAAFNKAARQPPTEWGPFTEMAEGLNGRLAMLGFGLLLFFEGAGPTAFFLN